MTSHNSILGSFQSAAKLVAILGMFAVLSASGFGQRKSITVPVIQSPQDLLALIPDTLDTRPGGEWNAAAISQANDILRGGSPGRPVKLTFNMRSMAESRTKGTFSVYGNYTLLPEPHPYKVVFNALFGPSDTDMLTKLSPGSDVTVTGTINGVALSLDRQVATLLIIVNSDAFNTFLGISTKPIGPANQTPPAWPTAPARPTAPASPTSADQATKNLVLAKGWETPMQGGSATMEDLGRILGEYARPGTNIAGDDSIVVYPSIPYLMPARQALETLKPGTRLPSKVLVSCPGFPRDSFYYYAIDGLFEGHYNRAYVVVDRAEQVVSVQFVDEHPINQAINSGKEPDWHTYNFVNNRVKSMNTLRIEHLPALFANNRWYETRFTNQATRQAVTTLSNWSVLRLRSVLSQPVRERQNISMKAMEEVLWYVPRPIAELILTCVQKSAK